MKLKLHLLLFYPSNWYICDSFLFHIEIGGNVGGLFLGGGGVSKGMLAPLKLLEGYPPHPPRPNLFLCEGLKLDYRLNWIQTSPSASVVVRNM